MPRYQYVLSRDQVRRFVLNKHIKLEAAFGKGAVDETALFTNPRLTFAWIRGEFYKISWNGSRYTFTRLG